VVDKHCDVAVRALRNFVTGTFPLIQDKPNVTIQKYLDAAFFFCQFIQEAEMAIGMWTDRQVLTGLDDYPEVIFRRFARLRDYLKSLLECTRTIHGMHAATVVLFVEGSSELAFLETMATSSAVWWSELRLESYDGKGNRSPKRIEMLLRKYNKEGYVVGMQGDADGSKRDVFQRLSEKGLVTKTNTFAFRHDFETSVPLPVLLDALHHLGYLAGVAVEHFQANLQGSGGSVCAAIKAHYQLDIEPIKKKLAVAIAHALNERVRWWWQDADFGASELGQFLGFIRQLG